MPDAPAPGAADRDPVAVFWEACARGELLLQRCADCARIQYYPRAVCSGCLGERLAWRLASGRASIHSHTTVHWSPLEAARADLPWVLAIVELEEGVRMITRVVDCAPERVRIGMPVEVCFVAGADGRALPVFRPAASDAGALT